MGYMRHHAIVVTSWRTEPLPPFVRDRADHPTLVQVHGKAQELCGHLVSPILGPFTNGYASFFIAPDGSKEGWDESETGAANRLAFLNWLRQFRFEDGSSYYDWVEVQFGDDEWETKVTADSDSRLRAMAAEEAAEKAAAVKRGRTDDEQE